MLKSIAIAYPISISSKLNQKRKKKLFINKWMKWDINLCEGAFRHFISKISFVLSCKIHFFQSLRYKWRTAVHHTLITYDFPSNVYAYICVVYEWIVLVPFNIHTSPRKRTHIYRHNLSEFEFLSLTLRLYWIMKP